MIHAEDFEPPTASRPYMPGYGIADHDEGLLPWAWAESRLATSRTYWVATVCPDGRPHTMPVWGVWHRSCLWFSSAPRSRKARNLSRDPRTTVTTEDTGEPVIVEGRAFGVTDREDNAVFAERINNKYGTDYAVNFYLSNATFIVRPDRAFGLTQTDFVGSSTRWEFHAPM